MIDRPNLAPFRRGFFQRPFVGIPTQQLTAQLGVEWRVCRFSPWQAHDGRTNLSPAPLRGFFRGRAPRVMATQGFGRPGSWVLSAAMLLVAAYSIRGVNLTKFGPRCVGVPTQQLPLCSNETQLKLFFAFEQTFLNAAFSARDQWTNNPQSPEPTGPAPLFEGGVHAPDQSAAGRV